MAKFRDFLREEEGSAGTTSANIATVDTKLDLIKRPKQKHLLKGHKCKKHNRVNCHECEDLTESKWK